jgi:phosphoribosylformylglycinamidine synthase
VADVAVTASAFDAYTGEAMAVGERSPVAVIDAPASGRLAVGEALTNIAAAPIGDIGRVCLSANWMAAAGHPGEDARLYDTVQAVAMALCPALGIAIPVGKDSLSMKTVWEEGGQRRAVTAPLSLIVSAFAPVQDVRRVLTPQLRTDRGATELVLIDLGRGRNRLGGSALAQVFGQTSQEPPDLDDPLLFKAFVAAIQASISEGRLLAYHDRSDGGLFACVTEMAFAGHCGIEIHLDRLGADPVAALFAEELGVILQVRRADCDAVLTQLRDEGLGAVSHVIGRPRDDDRIVFRHGAQTLLDGDRVAWHQCWSETSYRMQMLRDDPDCAQEELDGLADRTDPGLNALASFDPSEDVAAPFIATGIRPKVAILREQGVNGQVEMAAAFDRAGFAAVDVHMSDIASGRVPLAAFVGLAACGGFSYGDVLGAGEGWAKSILFNPRMREAFASFFERSDTFALGVCNGCQMLANLRELIPGAERWPHFVRNRSEQFEARVSLVEILPSSSLFFAGMTGSCLPIAVAHGEGRAELPVGVGPRELVDAGLVCLRYVDNAGRVTERYPANPNGSPFGITGMTTPDGRVTIMMPHPERMFRSVQSSWRADGWGEDGPWLRLFRNARRWVG